MLKKHLKKIVLCAVIAGTIISSFAVANAFTYQDSCLSSEYKDYTESGSFWSLETLYDFGTSLPYDDARIMAIVDVDYDNTLLYTAAYLVDGSSTYDNTKSEVGTRLVTSGKLSGHDQGTGYAIARFYDGNTVSSGIDKDMKLTVN